jgi:glycosyltransferase involved in cell wall biosynthesis
MNRALTIAFDTWCLASRFRHQGIYVYASNLLREFRQMACEHDVEFMPFVCAQAANDANALLPAPGFQPCQERLLRLNRTWRFGGGSYAARRAGAGLMFCPAGTTFSPQRIVPVVTTIHDIIPLLMQVHSLKVNSLLRVLLRGCAKFSRALITDSEYSRKDLIEICGVPESKVFVAYLGYNRAIYNDSPADPELQAELRQRLGIRRPYIFHHGALQPRKNLVALIAAYRQMLAAAPDLDFDLVLAGERGWRHEEILAAANYSGPGTVILPGALTDQELALLIKGAALIVIPSLYEGFCLPMVEAMACAAPVIAANGSCLPEVSGGVLRYFDPRSVEDMSACMRHALEDGALRERLARDGKRRAEQFDWRQCAERTLAILKQHSCAATETVNVNVAQRAS